jgi:hypothetical protein
MTKGEFPGAGLDNGMAPSLNVAFVGFARKPIPLKDIGKPFGTVLEDWMLGILKLIAPALLEEFQFLMEAAQALPGLQW